MRNLFFVAVFFTASVVFGGSVHADTFKVRDFFSMELPGWEVHDISGYQRKKPGKSLEWIGWVTKKENSLSVQRRDPSDMTFSSWVQESEKEGLSWYMHYCKCGTYTITSSKSEEGNLSNTEGLNVGSYKATEYGLKKGSAGKKDRAAIIVMSVSGVYFYIIAYDTRASGLSEGEGLLIAKELISSFSSGATPAPTR